MRGGVRRHPSAVLCAARLAGVLLYPFLEGGGLGRALLSIFGIAILGLVVPGETAVVGATGTKAGASPAFHESALERIAHV